jgi:hypothetical protein
LADQFFIDSTVVAATDQISSEVGDEVVILGLSRGRYYGLNQVGRFVWRLLQEPLTVHDLCDQVVAAYNVDREQAVADALDLINRLAVEGLVRDAHC